MTAEGYSFTHYLAAKKSVDNRAINRYVWQLLGESLPQTSEDAPLKVLEIGAGIGTMIERMLEWNLCKRADYTAIDSSSMNINFAKERLQDWAVQQGYLVEKRQDILTIQREDIQVDMKLLDIDLFDFLADQRNESSFDLLVAHAFLDLVDLPRTLPRIFKLGRSGSLFYFSINYDGLTIFEPLIDADFDRQVLDRYHLTMGARFQEGKLFGDSQSGRHLIQQIQAAGGIVSAAGSSDWVVFPGSSGYPEDEAYFLHFIIDTIFQALKNDPELDEDRFSAWVGERHAQIERQELVYIAHQLDYLGDVQSNP
ncbi:MAG: class I SAM-dependent methyltransferase [Chloroflexota bacterium]|nr:MAG: class I SAM-dependent methyltransferase [Chloroflexota bacterium]